MTTTPEKVRGIANHLKSMTDDQLQIYIADATLELEGMKLKKEAGREVLTRYLAAHLTSLNLQRAQSQKVSDLSLTYASSAAGEKGLDSTEYGQEYQRLLRKYGLPKINLTVI